MQSTTTFFLQSTEQLLTKAFPGGILQDFYLPLLTILEPEFSNRNLASAISHVTGKEYSEILNDIYRVKFQPFEDEVILHQVRSLLDDAGFQDWLEEN